MVGTFPLNVQEGSPQYTSLGEITPASGTTTISVTNPDSIMPISNAYYTIQNADGSKWCTFYVSQWTTSSANNYTGNCTYSSSNTSDVFPEGSVCWCIWCKEYYDSLITKIGSGVDWSEITGKPSTYPSSWSQISGKPSTYSPSLHAATHASDGSDPVTPASIGAAEADHTHPGAVQNITVVCNPVSGASTFTEIGFDAWVLPIVPGVTYTGSLRVSASSRYSSKITFIGSNFSSIGEFTATSQSPTTVSIPSGTKGIYAPSAGSTLQVYPFTMSYQ